MVDFTRNLGLSKPTIGANRDTWGSLLNVDLDMLDSFVFNAMPIGAIIDFAGPTPPAGWLACDGRLVSRVTYSALFAAIGTQWGTGDGSTTFGLPPTAGRATVGPGTAIDIHGTSASFTYATLGGAFSNPILQANLPNIPMLSDAQGNHAHGAATITAGYHTHTTDYQGSHQHGGGTYPESTSHTHSGNTDWEGNHGHNVYISTFGGGSSNGFQFEGNTQLNATNFPTDNQGNHYHNFTTSPENSSHNHYIVVDGSHSHNAIVAGDHTHQIIYDGSHIHTIMLGGGGQFLSVLPPVMVVTKIIYAGSQAAPPFTSVSVPTSAATAEDELTAIREELAELRAILAPRRQAVPRTPLRGMH